MEKYKFNNDDINDYIHNIGNLLVISLHTNSECQNKHIEEKFSIFTKKEDLPEAKYFVNKWQKIKWLKPEDIIRNIKTRAKDLGNRSYEVVKKHTMI